MIQEIYNYLLTREQIIKLSADELINQTKEKNNFVEMLKTLHDVMYRENIFLLKDEFSSKIEDWLHEFRFSYLNNKEINNLMNEIIETMQTYKNLNFKEKNDYVSCWIAKESIDRNIPHSLLISKDEILSYVLEDSTNLKFVLDGIETREFISNTIDPEKLLATFQVIRNQFPIIFQENRELLEFTIHLSKYISKQTTDRQIRKLANTYIKKVSYQMGKYYSQNIKKKEF